MTGPGMLAFILPIIYLCVLIFLISLAYRLVKAVEKIARTLEGK
jgi:hypothetical protein